MARTDTPYYSVSQATNRGARFGATIGMLGAIAALVVQPALVAGVYGGIIGVPLVGGFFGMLAGGSLFAASNAITHLVPGLSHATGEDKAPTKLEEQNKQIRRGEFTNVTTPNDFAKLEAGQSDIGTRTQQAETERLRQEAIAGR